MSVGASLVSGAKEREDRDGSVISIAWIRKK